ncbi:TetR/AcrR family transcriptional regulator [Pedosphaera parvula]|uniref:Transcriptional regulator, TetR family n=1 Tax=Pedosphaera parvula (strain Ellin514) TaxID=320771 RepID=B9XN76_PEDPL|nr:TetR/AcrR family transcriptional regulator [Pedosphaera parvula]EEF58738.1 transcriptional regulator, TetR family [Pedosphaera parvula Ellin514]
MGRTSDAKGKLLDVAFDLIWQQSYGAVSVDDICDRAQVKKGSFYHFFPSKSDLAVAAYEEHWQQSRPRYDSLFSPQTPPLERLENYCKRVYAGQKEKLEKTGRVLGCPFACAGSELSTQDEKIRVKSKEMFDRMCKYIESTLVDAHKAGLIESQDFPAKSQAIFCFVLGRLLQARVSNDVEVLRDLAPTVMQMIGAQVPA